MHGRGKKRRRTEVKKKEKERKRKEARERGNAAHRETDESNAVARREDVGTIEMEVVRVRSIRIGSS